MAAYFYFYILSINLILTHKDLLAAIKDSSINTIGGDINDIIAEEEFEDDDDDDEDEDESAQVFLNTSTNSRSGSKRNSSRDNTASQAQTALTTQSGSRSTSTQNTARLEEEESEDKYNIDADLSSSKASGTTSAKQAAPKLAQTTMSFHMSSFLTERVLKADKSSFGFGMSANNLHGSDGSGSDTTTSNTPNKPSGMRGNRLNVAFDEGVKSVKDGNAVNMNEVRSRMAQLHYAQSPIAHSPQTGQVQGAVQIPPGGMLSPHVSTKTDSRGNILPTQASSSRTPGANPLVSTAAGHLIHAHPHTGSLTAGGVPAPPMQRGNSLAVLLQRGASLRSTSKRFFDAQNQSFRSNLRENGDDDDTDNIQAQPVYLRGGSNVKGLDTLLGNALSLLFVSRHGLKEREMWALLGTLSWYF
jgi:hypothetical protein